MKRLTFLVIIVAATVLLTLLPFRYLRTANAEPRTPVLVERLRLKDARTVLLPIRYWENWTASSLYATHSWSY